MVRIPTYDAAQRAPGERELDARALGDRVLYRTLKEAVVQYQANGRQGDAHTRVRSEVAGSKRKPWKQKHTGRARAGDRRSPLWRGGATVFGPRNCRAWVYRLPRKQRMVAVRSALLGKLRDGEVREVRSLGWAAPSARQARQVLCDCAPAGTVLLLLAQPNPVLWRSFRNFPQVSVRTAADANAYDLLAHKWLLAEQGALEALLRRLAPVHVEA